MQNIANDDLLTVGQVAELLGKAPRTILHRIAVGQLPATKLGTGKTSAYVIRRADVEALVRAAA